MTTEPLLTTSNADPGTAGIHQRTAAADHRAFCTGRGLIVRRGGVGVRHRFVPFAVGAAIFVVGLISWIVEMLPGRGHVHLEAVEALPQPVIVAPGAVEHLVAGTPGYRVQLPRKIHPVSAGVWGGMLGGRF